MKELSSTSSVIQDKRENTLHFQQRDSCWDWFLYFARTMGSRQNAEIIGMEMSSMARAKGKQTKKGFEWAIGGKFVKLDETDYRKGDEKYPVVKCPVCGESENGCLETAGMLSMEQDGWYEEVSFRCTICRTIFVGFLIDQEDTPEARQANGCFNTLKHAWRFEVL